MTAAAPTFYLGTHQPAWLATASVPLFVSHRRLASRQTLPRAAAPCALDSGGFSELSLDGEWRTNARQYVAAVRLTSVDSLAWSVPGRHEPGCNPTHTTETNCQPSALAWRAELLARLHRAAAGNWTGVPA